MNTKVSDLSPLEGLTRLYWIDLSGTPVSSDQVEALRKTHPHLTLHFSRERELGG